MDCQHGYEWCGCHACTTAENAKLRAEVEQLRADIIDLNETSRTGEQLLRRLREMAKEAQR